MRYQHHINNFPTNHQVKTHLTKNFYSDSNAFSYFITLSLVKWKESDIHLKPLSNTIQIFLFNDGQVTLYTATESRLHIKIELLVLEREKG